jgi:PQQ-dependent dehydrogenase (methanol/ethanol family)
MLVKIDDMLRAVRKRGLAVAFLVVLFAGFGGTALLGQGAVAPDLVTNPMAGNQEAIAAGKTLYAQTCANCHGEDARGDRGPSLASGNFSHGGTDADLFHTIRNGVAGTQMPAFAALPADTIWRIIAYLRSLSGAGEGANEVVPGDAAAGEKIFWGKGGCGACHEVNERGGDVGPDLSAAGMNAAAQLRAEILNPNAPPGRGGRRRFFGPDSLLVTTRDGREIQGLRRAEDSYTLIMTGVDGKLYRFDRRDLEAEKDTHKSLMRADYGQLLSPAELENLIAYLKSLKERDLSKTIQVSLPGGVSFATLRDSQAEPQNWLTYWGGYKSHHFSALDEITPANVHLLQAKWSEQIPGSSVVESTPLVVDGTMYTSGQPGQVLAIDARSGLEIWRYERQQKVVNPYQTNPYNRGVAILGDRLFLGTLDAAVVALDARTGRELWETQVADTMKGYTLTLAPLAIQGKVIVGVSGGEFGIRGFIDAYDAATGKRLWRFYTIPGPREPGNSTWSGDSWKRGGAPAWLTGSYDPELNLLYWGVGNPGPDYNGSVREGDDLYSCSVVALDPDTGKLKWYYQFTPGDTHDWDATEDLVLADRVQGGKTQKVLLQANRNGMYYVLDRTNGKLLLAKPYVRVTWNHGYGPDGRPILAPETRSTPQGTVVYPTIGGGSNWQSPSYDAAHSMLYVVAQDMGNGVRSVSTPYEAGREWTGGGPYRIASDSRSGVFAIDAETGAVKWRFPLEYVSPGAGVLATASGLVFGSTVEGNLIALDAKSGQSLWHFQTGARMNCSPMSYAVDGRQFVAVSAGNALYSFALPEP